MSACHMYIKNVVPREVLTPMGTVKPTIRLSA